MKETESLANDPFQEEDDSTGGSYCRLSKDYPTDNVLQNIHKKKEEDKVFPPSFVYVGVD